MTQGQSRSEHPARARLGQELARIRMLSGLSGRQVSQQIGIPQATLSRIERGQSTASLPQVNTWADAVGATEEQRALLLSLAEAAVNEVVTHRTRLDGVGLPTIQEEVGELEATARTVRNFQPGIIPGLLQTAEYARRILTFADPTADIPTAITARLTRQQLLHDSSRSFEFLLTEQALRFRPGPREMLVGQLDHLAALVTLETISFGVIPADAQMHAITRCGFILYEDRLEEMPACVVIETPHSLLTASDPADVAIYRGELEAFRKSAVYGNEALDIVRAIAHPHN
jgi:transcriptional regulator with XRE-family HTH domain